MRTANGLLVVLCALAVVAFVVIVVRQQGESQRQQDHYQRLLAEAVASCDASNAAREQLNDQLIGVVDSFLATAEQARRTSGSRGDIAAANKYALLEDRNKPLPIRDCSFEKGSDE